MISPLAILVIIGLAMWMQEPAIRKHLLNLSEDCSPHLQPVIMNVSLCTKIIGNIGSNIVIICGIIAAIRWLLPHFGIPV